MTKVTMTTKPPDRYCSACHQPLWHGIKVDPKQCAGETPCVPEHVYGSRGTIGSGPYGAILADPS